MAVRKHARNWNQLQNIFFLAFAVVVAPAQNSCAAEHGQWDEMEL